MLEQFFCFAGVLPDALFLVERQGNIIAANSPGCALLGYTNNAVVGRSLSDLVNDSEDAVERLLTLWARSKQALPGSLSFRLASGESKACRCEGGVYRPRSDRQPTVLLLRATASEGLPNQFITLNRQIGELTREISRRVSAERELRAQREWLEVTLSSIGDAVIAADVESRVTFINPTACALTGWPQEACIGRPLSEIFRIVNEDTREPVESPVTKVFREGTVAGLANHTVLVRRDGTEVAIDDAGAPIRDDTGTIIGAVLVFHDITERRVLERELRAKAEALEEANRRKDEFLAMLSHELRNPLAPLRNCIAVLERTGNAATDVPTLLQTMQRQVSHLTRMVDDLLDVSRITRGKINLIKRPLRVDSVVKNAIDALLPAITAKHQKLEVQLADGVLVDADDARLTQVFCNVVENAIKYTPTGGSIDIRSYVEDGFVIAKIRDNGVGIRVDVLPRIFELFEQAERSLDRSQGGLGVGLALVRSLVEMHGGSVTGHSDGLGRGSEFTIRLPVRDVAEDAATSSEVASRATGASRGKVLVVDDSTDAADSLRILIMAWGFDVRVAYSADAALEQSAAFEPDFAILDIGMPGKDGYALAAELRLAFPHAVLIALSGYGTEHDRARGERAGFNHHLTKPGDLSLLERLLSEPRTQDE